MAIYLIYRKVEHFGLKQERKHILQISKLLGLEMGGLFLENDASQARFCDAEVGLSRNYTVTNGGFYVEGDTTIATMNYILTFDLLGTLTVNAVTLCDDTGSYTPNNNIRPLATSSSNPGGSMSL
jgi:hypothetical protein